ncbi:DUF4286 family protein [Zeaxanthinibacter enoshimensis]|uniref:Uncharacterized protein DUF4286 n=1 Tax=Zeaxanthinibacter enoshimensis TaxID=392009 RepID=A0A4R6TMR0_9FLAO|nr:DUF4286 family protein [Zeaxanthinibacter enoshimensis]TDQ32505.1 uncharacterized protein DUF4286 [Zeaxanthinibacter enoshimensis]
MYIYNVTVNVEAGAHREWLKWMQEAHIPDVLSTGKFTNARMCRVLVTEETGGYTYAIQYTTPDQDTLQQYYREDAERLRTEVSRLFGEKVVAFRTELEIISEHQH